VKSGNVHIFNKNVPVYILKGGNIPLLVVGPADLFRKAHMLPTAMSDIFTIYFVDLFFFRKESIHPDFLVKIDLNYFVGVIESIRQQLKLAKFALFAHSALGILAYEYALHYPHRTSSLILVATSPVWGKYKNNQSLNFFTSNASDKRKKLHKEDQDQFKISKYATEQQQFIDNYLARRTWFFHNPDEKTSQSMWKDISYDMKLVNRYFQLIENYDMRKKPLISTPMFVALGAYDASAPFYLWTDDISTVLNKSCYYIFCHSAHYPMMEEPHLFMEQLNLFLIKERKPMRSYIAKL